MDICLVRVCVSTRLWIVSNVLSYHSSYTFLCLLYIVGYHYMLTYASMTYALRKPHINCANRTLIEDITVANYTSLYLLNPVISNDKIILLNTGTETKYYNNFYQQGIVPYYMYFSRTNHVTVNTEDSNFN